MSAQFLSYLKILASVSFLEMGTLEKLNFKIFSSKNCFLVQEIFFLIKFSIMLLSLGIFNWPIQKWVVNWKRHSIRPRHGWESIGLRRRSNIRLWNSRLGIYFHALVRPVTRSLENLSCVWLFWWAFGHSKWTTIEFKVYVPHTM